MDNTESDSKVNMTLLTKQMLLTQDLRLSWQRFKSGSSGL